MKMMDVSDVYIYIYVLNMFMFVFKHVFPTHAFVGINCVNDLRPRKDEEELHIAISA